jgi:hypothetical protein
VQRRVSRVANSGTARLYEDTEGVATPPKSRYFYDIRLRNEGLSNRRLDGR